MDNRRKHDRGDGRVCSYQSLAVDQTPVTVRGRAARLLARIKEWIEVSLCVCVCVYTAECVPSAPLDMTCISDHTGVVAGNPLEFGVPIMWRLFF